MVMVMVTCTFEREGQRLQAVPALELVVACHVVDHGADSYLAESLTVALREGGSQ